MSDITTLHVQREIKPKIEDVLPFFANGETLETALDFIDYLRAKKMNPAWAGVHNAWKCNCKAKPICYIRLNCKLQNENRHAKWAVTPYFMNISDYEDKIIKAGWQDLIWNGLWRCKSCGNGCPPGVNKTILGKELKSLCHGNFYSGRNWVWFYDPDEMTISQIKTLLDWEKEARKAK